MSIYLLIDHGCASVPYIGSVFVVDSCVFNGGEEHIDFGCAFNSRSRKKPKRLTRFSCFSTEKLKKNIQTHAVTAGLAWQVAGAGEGKVLRCTFLNCANLPLGFRCQA
jgi:hypothetical protein